MKTVGLAQLLPDVPELHAIALHSPPVAILHSWTPSETAVKCTVKRRAGETPLNGKEDAHQPDSAVQLVGLFIKDHYRVCHLYSQ